MSKKQTKQIKHIERNGNTLVPELVNARDIGAEVTITFSLTGVVSEVDTQFRNAILLETYSDKGKVLEDIPIETITKMVLRCQ